MLPLTKCCGIPLPRQRQGGVVHTDPQPNEPVDVVMRDSYGTRRGSAFLLLLLSLTLGEVILGASRLEVISGSRIAIAQTPSPETSPTEDSEAANEPKIEPGSEGVIVRELQQHLKELGYYEEEPDGVYGASTEAAVRAFQEAEGLEPTGVFDAQAWIRMQEIRNPRPEPQPQERGRISRRALAVIGLGGLTTLIGMAIGIFLILKFLAQRAQDQEFAVQTEIGSERYPDYEQDPSNNHSKFVTLQPESPPTQPLNLDPPILSESLLEDAWLADSVLPPPPAKPEPLEEVALEEVAEAENPLPTNPPITASPPEMTIKPAGRLVKLDLIEELIGDLRSPNLEKRHKAIWELAQRADSRAVKPLVGLLIESDSQQQTLILEALSQIGTRTLKPMNRALALSLQDDNAQVRKNAIRDLTRMYELVAQLSQLVYYATDDPDPEVQNTAKWALKQLNQIRVLPDDQPSS
ncbi:peptidoglycan-binding protein [Spirulina subsalsa FACHB-351]|uniref:Peptidoglycan-binding protein n=1 Tax=Spirulina subsalsa FACHB-351 TaxID=234711 RepID=A0ABT3L8U3_9CYAN|nr:peptidoglycan-binding protein [Spirulina subsalsa]MCW6037572.1 peptidoglycan-binding protein [Spirulina subsalsa FACHB-351]